MAATISPIAAGPTAPCASPSSIRAGTSVATDPASAQALVATLDPSIASASSRASGHTRASRIIGTTAAPPMKAKAGPCNSPIAASPSPRSALIGSIRIDSRKRSPTASMCASAISTAMR